MIKERNYRSIVYIVSMLIVLCMLIVGCNDKKENDNPSALKDNGDIVAIQMRETGGEDGRAEEWSICYKDNKYMFCYKNNYRLKFPDEKEFEISESEYRDVVDIDFSKYIGKEDDTAVIFDAVYYDTVIQYENGVSESTKACIPSLIDRLYELLEKYDS